MRRLLLPMVLAALAIAASPAAAAPVTVTFDDLPAGASANEAYAARGIHFGISPQGAEGAVTVAASAGARSAPNAGAFQYDGSMSHAWMRFDTAQSQVTLHTCAESGASLSIDAIAVDASGNQVDSQLGIPCTAGTPEPITLSGAANISYVAIGKPAPAGSSTTSPSTAWGRRRPSWQARPAAPRRSSRASASSRTSGRGRSRSGRARATASR